MTTPPPDIEGIAEALIGMHYVHHVATQTAHLWPLFADRPGGEAAIAAVNQALLAALVELTPAAVEEIWVDHDIANAGYPDGFYAMVADLANAKLIAGLAAGTDTGDPQ